MTSVQNSEIGKTSELPDDQYFSVDGSACGVTLLEKTLLELDDIFHDPAGHFSRFSYTVIRVLDDQLGVQVGSKVMREDPYDSRNELWE